MQKRMHHEVMIDAQTLYSVVKAAYPEVTHLNWSSPNPTFHIGYAMAT